jgi:hypothetical protein
VTSAGGAFTAASLSGAGSLDISVPAGAVTGDTVFWFRSLPLPAPSGGMRPIAAFSLTTSSLTTSSVAASSAGPRLFPVSLTATFHYTRADLGEVDERMLRLYATVARVRIEPLDCAIDTNAHLIVCAVPHAGDFEVAGGVPVRPTGVRLWLPAVPKGTAGSHRGG